MLFCFQLGFLSWEKAEDAESRRRTDMSSKRKSDSHSRGTSRPLTMKSGCSQVDSERDSGFSGEAQHASSAQRVCVRAWHCRQSKASFFFFWRAQIRMRYINIKQQVLVSHFCCPFGFELSLVKELFNLNGTCLVNENYSKLKWGKKQKCGIGKRVSRILKCKYTTVNGSVFRRYWKALTVWTYVRSIQRN